MIKVTGMVGQNGINKNKCLKNNQDVEWDVKVK